MLDTVYLLGVARTNAALLVSYTYFFYSDVQIILLARLLFRLPTIDRHVKDNWSLCLVGEIVTTTMKVCA